MIRLARDRSAGYTNIEYRVADSLDAIAGARLIQHVEWRYTVVWTAPNPRE